MELPFPFWASTFGEEFGCKVSHVFAEVAPLDDPNYEFSRSVFLKDSWERSESSNCHGRTVCCKAGRICCSAFHYRLGTSVKGSVCLAH